MLLIVSLFFFSSPTSVNDTKLDIPCLGEFGGPVGPSIALGGFDGTAYQNASTLIITFVVNNHLDKSKLGRALAWEKAFIEFMKKYTDNRMNNNLTISFSAERSIQDELDRESETDVVTILVSYMIMFLYITVALGQYTDCSRIMVSSIFSVISKHSKVLPFLCWFLWAHTTDRVLSGG